MTHCTQRFGLLPFWINTGVHRRSSVQSPFNCYVYLGRDTRRLPVTTDASDIYGIFVDVGATLLESTAPLAPRSFRSLASSSPRVGFPFIPAIVCLLVN